MTWTLLAPASAIVLSVGVLAWSMLRLGAELAALRGSLRRTRATAVATDEVRRESRVVAARAARIEADSRVRADLRRSRRRSARR